MKTLSAEEAELLRTSLSCDMCDEPENELSARLERRGLLTECSCDDPDITHIVITPLGRTALACAKALEMTP